MRVSTISEGQVEMAMYWSGLPFPSPGDLPDPGTEPGSPALQADTLMSEPPGKPKCCLNGANTTLIISMLHS